MKGNKIALASSALVLVSALVALAANADETVYVRPGDKTEVLLKSPSDDGRVVRLKMPAGVVTNTADLVVRNAASAVVEIDGRGTTYVMPRRTDGKYWGPAFKVSAGRRDGSALWQFDYNGAGKTVAPGTLSDFLVRVDNTGDRRILSFAEGRFEFGPTSYTRLFTGNPGDEKDAVIEICPKACLRSPANVALSHPSRKSTVLVRGGRLELPGSIMSFGPYWGTLAKTDTPRTVCISVREGGTFRFGEYGGRSLSLGSSTKGSTSNVTFAVMADASTVCQVGGGYTVRTEGPGRHAFVFRNGSKASFAGTVSLGGKPGATGLVAVENSEANFARTLTLGDGGHAKLTALNAKLSFDDAVRVVDGAVVLGNGTEVSLSAKGAICGNGAASSISADGARVSVDAKGAERPLGGFATAAVGAGGLTLSSARTVTIEQSFCSERGAKGVLRLEGAGTKRIVGDVLVDKLVATGGSVEITGACTAKVVSKEGSVVRVGDRIVSFGKRPNEDVLMRFADVSTYEIVEIDGGRGFDLGRTARRPDSTFFFDRRTNTVCTAIVPCEEYVRAWVLCSVDPDPKKDRHFTVRLTRYANAARDSYQGRSRRGMADTHVDFDTADKEKLPGGRWLVEVALATGDIQDVLYVDKHDSRSEVAGELKRRGLGRYLDLELLGRTRKSAQPLHACTQNADPKKTSAVTVYDVALERPPCEMRMLWTQPGNIFHNDEKPETKVALTVHRPGRHVLEWVVRNPEDKVVKTGSIAVAASGTNTVDLSQDELGWYRLDWTLKDGKRTMLTHTASFALLGPDTRTTEAGEPPYGTGGSSDWHYRIPAELHDVAGALFLKAGFRRTECHVFRHKPAEVCRKWKLSPAFCMRFHLGWTNSRGERIPDDKLKAKISKTLENFPFAANCMIFHENAPEPYRQAEEILGGVHSNDMKNAEHRYKMALQASDFMRTNFPNVKITIGNSLVCTELLADLMRRGFPKGNADYMGLESVVRENLPERISASALQGADMMRETAAYFGYPWKPNACFEFDYRRHSVLGYDRQAQWYVRDLLIQQCWRFPDIFVGDLVTVGNHYAESFWGDAGICERWPMLYPFKSYVGLATATKVLDRVTGRIHVPTGDDGVFLVAFPRKDGKVAYAFWTARGEAELELETSAKFTITDFFGRTRMPKSASKMNFVPGKEKHFMVHASEWMGYIVADAQIVKSARTLSRAYPEDDARAKTFRKVADTSDFNAWTVSNGLDCGVQRRFGKYPCRRPGKGAARAVVDPEKGRVIELELVDPDYKLPVNVDEYTTLVLKKPVPLAGKPLELGMWVKGNSGWGSVYFIIKDAHGRLHTNSGYPQYGEMDHSGTTTVCFSGWHYVTAKLGKQGSLHWTCATLNDYPASLVGVAFSAQNRPLVLDERAPRRQVIRIASFGVRGDLDENRGLQ